MGLGRERSRGEYFARCVSGHLFLCSTSEVADDMVGGFVEKRSIKLNFWRRRSLTLNIVGIVIKNRFAQGVDPDLFLDLYV